MNDLTPVQISIVEQNPVSSQKLNYYKKQLRKIEAFINTLEGERKKTIYEDIQNLQIHTYW